MRSSKPAHAVLKSAPKAAPKPQASASVPSTAGARTGTNDSEWEEF
jgi:hypothetical protein